MKIPSVLLLFALCTTLMPPAADAAGKAGAPASARYTLVGSTVGNDGVRPVPGVQVTIHPAGLAARTDEDGDFLLPWNGGKSWLTFEATDPKGQPWCKRIAVKAEPGAPGELVDVGKVTVAPASRLIFQTIPWAPQGERWPGVLRVPGPKPGEADTSRITFRYTTDLWGEIHEVKQTGGDQNQPAVRDALFDWVRSVRWQVSDEAPCEGPDPFQATGSLFYAWADTGWVKTEPRIWRNRQSASPGLRGAAPAGR